MNASTVTMLRIIADAIREAGSEGIPSGHLYAMMMDRFSSAMAYQSFIDVLKRAGIVSESGHILKFVEVGR